MKFKLLKVFCFVLICLGSGANCFADGWDDFVNGLEAFFTMQVDGTCTFGGPDPNSSVVAPIHHYIKLIPVGGKYGLFVPPWNRDVAVGGLPCDNQPRQNCLRQFGLDSYSGDGGGMFLDRTCASDNPDNYTQNSDSTYSNSPTIEIDNMVCLSGFCFRSDTLKLNGIQGECGMLPTKEIVVARRVCARIAYPASSNNSSDPNYMPADDGYTSATYPDKSKSNSYERGQHLDIYGVTQWDDLVTSDDQNTAPFPLMLPKMCAYEDPWAMDYWPAVDGKIVPDAFDLDPNHQPFHCCQGDISPIAQLMIFILDSLAGVTEAGVDIVGLIVSGIGTTMNKDFGNGLSLVFNIISQVIEVLKDSIVWLLQQVGQVNRIVIGHYGCINIPLGPYPPAYCNTSETVANGYSDPLKIVIPPSPFPICTTDAAGNIIHNTYLSSQQVSNFAKSRCVLSNVDNNFLYNSVRVAYNNPIPLCSGNQTINCFTFNSSALSGLQSSDLRNKVVSQQNLISVGDVTLQSPIIPAYNNTTYYRALYATYNYIGKNSSSNGSSSVRSALGAVQSIDQFYYSDLHDCNDLFNGVVASSSTQNSGTSTTPKYSSNTCQMFYGIDVGHFSDQFIIDYTQSSTAQNNKVYSSAQILHYVPPAAVDLSTQLIKHFYVYIDPADALNMKVYELGDGSDTSHPNYASDNADVTKDNNIGTVARAPLPLYATHTNSSNYNNDKGDLVSGLSVQSCSDGSSKNHSPCMQVVVKAIGQKIGASQKTYSAVSANISSSPFAYSMMKSPPVPVVKPNSYLGGVNFSSYATDDNNRLPPFFPATASGAKESQSTSYPFKLIVNGQVSTNSILGMYKDKIFDPSNNCPWDTCATYLGGMEVIEGNYVRGGTWFCLDDDPKYNPQYSQDPTQAILANTNAAGGASFALGDRNTPASSVGLLLPQDKYYVRSPLPQSPPPPQATQSQVSNSVVPYVSPLQLAPIPKGTAIRNKVGAERLDRCVKIPPPDACPAYVDSDTHSSWCSLVNGKNVDTNGNLCSAITNSFWCANGKDPYGNTCQVLQNQITGSCTSGYVPKNPKAMGGYCLMPYANGTYTPSAVSDSDASLFAGCSVINGAYITATMNGNSLALTNVVSRPDGSGSFTINQGGIFSGTYDFEISIYTNNNINLRVLNLLYDDYIRVYANNNQISNDVLYSNDAKAARRKYTIWSADPSAVDTGGGNYYPDLSGMNTLLNKSLVVGTNTIKLSLRVVGGGSINIDFSYNK